MNVKELLDELYELPEDHKEYEVVMLDSSADEGDVTLHPQNVRWDHEKQKMILEN